MAQSRFWKTILRQGRLRAFLRAVDPRTVRLRDPSRHLRRSVGIAIAACALVAGAAAIAAARAPARTGNDEGFVLLDVESAVDAPVQRAAAPVLEQATDQEAAARHPRFHDMYYVFTQVPPSRATAYPLANPPGIVVDLEGVPEPEESARSLVGEDDRIRSVKRRVTGTGLRYIIAITTPVTRLEVEHEGEVVIVTPVR